MSGRPRPRLASIGAGRLASALLPRLAEAGWPVTAVWSRDRRAARRLARKVSGARAAGTPLEAAESARVILVAVPDRAIVTVARELARSARSHGGWKGRVVLHHAGALGLDPLRPLAELGAAVGVLHPLQVLGSGPADRPLPSGTRARIEGDPAAVRVARRLARELGMRPLVLPREDSPSRAAYHAAASMAANDLVALLDLAAGVLESAGVGRREALAALAALARGALERLERGGLEAALTGPVARGDAATVAAQLRRLRRSSREASRVHRDLSRHLARLAFRSGRLDGGSLRLLRALLGD